MQWLFVLGRIALILQKLGKFPTPRIESIFLQILSVCKLYHRLKERLRVAQWAHGQSLFALQIISFDKQE
jgi:hypothetical protein